MLIALLVVVVLTDLVLLWLVLRTFRPFGVGNMNTVLADMAEERQIFQRMIDEAGLRLESFERQGSELLGNMKQIAFEADAEIRSGKKALTDYLTEIVNNFSIEAEGPLAELARRQQALETSMRRLTEERSRLQRLVTRGETLAKLLQVKKPYEVITEEIERRKVDEIRELVARGYDAEEIARELGVSQAEVALVATAQ